MERVTRRYWMNGSRSGAQKERRNPKSRSERVRLTQLTVCLVLFLAVFAGKGMMPEQMTKFQSEALDLLTSNTDFREMLTEIGEAISSDGSFEEGLETFCTGVFGLEEKDIVIPSMKVLMPKQKDILEEELSFLGEGPDPAELTAHYFPSCEVVQLTHEIEATAADQKQILHQPVLAAETLDTVPAAGVVLLKSDYNGTPLPDRYTMDQLSLGDLKTVTPVMGYQTSEYGYRDHPISGRYQFHGGVDIGGQSGDPIGAFADGTVEYIGEDDSYGLYMQVDHGNGVKSFYAHCSKLCAVKGQSVKAGEKIAEIGSTGCSTGPHLHLEIKYQDMHLNPAYYIEFLSWT